MLKHISQKRFFIEIISSYKDKRTLVCQGLTNCAISNFPYNNKRQLETLSSNPFLFATMCFILTEHTVRCCNNVRCIRILSKFYEVRWKVITFRSTTNLDHRNKASQ
ncbi:hypothetical protein V8G54_036564 [Vigna mungo]|uniref:Uncharacterized protein n=1 Tax=Vigna mungo TaxID=3915 RepID=A0AAQ3MHG3_VIGMU